MKNKPDAKVPESSAIDYAIDKGRLYGIAKLLDTEGYGACARDVRAAADYIHAGRTATKH